MPLLPAEQGQLATLLTKVDELELVRLARLIYEAIQMEKLPTEKAILLGKQMLSKLEWEKANIECRLALIPISRNIMERFHLIFGLEAEAPAETPEAPKVEVVTPVEAPKAEASLKPARPAKKNSDGAKAPEVVTEPEPEPKPEVQA